MSKNQIWLSPENKNSDWKIHKPNSQRAIKITDTKQEGFEIARKIAKNQGLELVIQNKDGQIGEKNTYPRSRDKFPPKG